MSSPNNDDDGYSIEIPFENTVEEADVPPAVAQAQAISGDTEDPTVSNVTFVGSAGGLSDGTTAPVNPTERTEGGARKINHQDVRYDVFTINHS